MPIFPSEVLLRTFKYLNSVDMVRAQRVCKSWRDVVESDTTSHTRLILPKRKAPWNTRKALEVFDRKSNSTLEEVSMFVKLEKPEVDAFVQILMRSKKTLKFVEIDPKDFGIRIALSQLAWKLPHLVEFRVESLREPGVRFTGFKAPRRKSPKLKILWTGDSNTIFKSHLHLLDNLSSLYVIDFQKVKEWRRILEKPSKTLKHLHMLIGGPASESEDLPDLHFPRLRVLELHAWQNFFPKWMKIPTSSTLVILQLAIPPTLPSVTTLCISGLSNIDILVNNCPILKVLRIETGTHRKPAAREWVRLLAILSWRWRKVRGREEIDGVERKHIETIYISHKRLKAHYLRGLRSFDAECIDLGATASIFDVEV